MSEPDFVERLGDELTDAARRQMQRRRAGWRGRLPRPLARTARGRGLVLIGAVALVGAGGTAGLLAARGEVGGPPSLEFARVSPQQRAAGVKPLTRPVVFARGRLAHDGRPWQLVGFQTTRGLCIEIDFPRQHRAGGCGAPAPHGGGRIDWQAQIADWLRQPARPAGLVLGAVDPAATAVRVRHGFLRRGARSRGQEHRSLQRKRSTRARVIHVREPRLLAAMGLRRPFTYWIAELDGDFHGILAEAHDAEGALLGRARAPFAMSDMSSGVAFRGRRCERAGFGAGKARAVSTLPPPAVSSRIAALRRPQRPSDLPPRRFLQKMLASPHHATVMVDAIRLLRRTPSGERLYLVPTTARPPDITPSPECLRTLTPRQREQEAKRQRRASAYARQLYFAAYALGRRVDASAAHFDLGAYERGRAAYRFNGRRMTGMAPDGVASVEVRFRDGTRITAPVRGNVWIATAPPASGRPRAVLWHAADGRVVRRLR